LIEAAKAGMNNAYAILNNFPVGAAVLTSKGKGYPGCNTQSVIFGMGGWAERSAIDHAVGCGEKMFQKRPGKSETQNADCPLWNVSPVHWRVFASRKS